MSKLYITYASIVGLLMLLAVKELRAQSPGTTWSYIEIDNDKPKWGDFAEPKWLRYFGLDMGDLNGDGYKDVLTGRMVYLNPGSDMSADWSKVDLGMNVDGILVMDVDGDEYGDVIAQALPNIYWFEATNKEGTKWEATKIGEVPATSHVNSQGFAKAQIIAGGKEEFVIAGDGNIYSFEIPKKPHKEDWKVTLIAANTSDEGIGIGDIDGDGDIDIAAGRRHNGGKEPLILVWFENPGNGGAKWQDHAIGKTSHPIDRVAVADMNADGKADIVLTEERHPGREPDGNIFWFQQPNESGERWKRNAVVTQYSSNNLDVKDMDGDGDMDIITCEHKNEFELQVWRNDGLGNFTKELVDKGKESHLGTQVDDMDGDGDMDIVSIGWKNHQFVHLWRNEDSKNTGKTHDNKGKFYKEYWAEFDSTITPKNLNHWRVNDEEVSLHKSFGSRKEPTANGLIMIPIKEDLSKLEKAELYIELWGGHVHTDNKRFYLNGRGAYYLPRTGVENGYYSYTNPTIPLKIQNLVNGKNAFQFAVDKAESFWGHYIVAETALKCFLKQDHPELKSAQIDNFDATVHVDLKKGFLKDLTRVSLTYSETFKSNIDSVVYFARYTGFDDQGLLKNNYWHGITMNRQFVNHVGSSKSAPYNVDWDTEMLPDQSGPMAIRSIVYLKNGIRYQTEITDNLLFPKNRNTVRMYSCYSYPKKFGSRISKEKTAYIMLPDNIDHIEKAQLVIKNWGSHHGHNEDPFKFNDTPYDLFSDHVSRLISFSRIDISPERLVPGKNIFSVFSDTEHHSLEIFLPGPVLLVKEKSEK